MQNNPISRYIANRKTKQPSKHPVLKWVGISLAAIFVMNILVIGWLGFVPGLSNVLGATKARDLGVSYSQSDYENYQTKSGINLVNDAKVAPNSLSRSIVLTDEEATAALNNVNWRWMIMDNIQVRFSDGVIELSGKINDQKLANLDNSSELSSNDSKQLSSWLNRVANNAPVYIKLAGNVTDNVLSLQVKQVTIGRLNLPVAIFDDLVKSANQKTLGGNSDFRAENVKLSNGLLQFEGLVPTNLYIEQ